jgi:hypothetical protein
MTAQVSEITVQYVNMPKAGKKFGSIKSSEGVSYWAPPAVLREFTVGEVCKIEFKENDEGFKNINKKIGSTKAPPLSPPPRQRTDPTDQRHIFVTALLGHFIDAGKLSLDEEMIAEAADMILRAYKRSSLGGGAAQRSDAMDDEIPF